MVARLLGAVTTQEEALSERCMREEASVCLQNPSLAPQLPAQALFLPEGLAPRPRLIGGRDPGQGVWL